MHKKTGSQCDCRFEKTPKTGREYVLGVICGAHGAPLMLMRVAPQHGLKSRASQRPALRKSA